MTPVSISRSPDDKRFVISFPFDRKIIDITKTISGAKFDGAEKVWTVPYSILSLSRIIKTFSKDVCSLFLASELGDDVRQALTYENDVYERNQRIIAVKSL